MSFLIDKAGCASFHSLLFIHILLDLSLTISDVDFLVLKRDHCHSCVLAAGDWLKVDSQELECLN